MRSEGGRCEDESVEATCEESRPEVQAGSCPADSGGVSSGSFPPGRSGPTPGGYPRPLLTIDQVPPGRVIAAMPAYNGWRAGLDRRGPISWTPGGEL